MQTATLKAYYKALITKKDYIVQSDISTNFQALTYKATNIINDDMLSDYTIVILDTNYYCEYMDIAQNMVDTISKQWTKDCYYYSWDEYINKYDMTPYQFRNLQRILKYK